MGRKNHEARRIAELATQRAAKENRMRHPMGTSAYAKKLRRNNGKSLTWLDKPEAETAPQQEVPPPPQAPVMNGTPTVRIRMPSGKSAIVAFVKGRPEFI